MRKYGKWLVRLLLGVLAIAVILSVAGLVYFRGYMPGTVAPRSFPQVNGRLQLKGLDGQVDVYRDNMGIPHIYATTLHDLFLSQGYVHAQDRFWQMDAWRHIGSGTLSEMFGDTQVNTDIFLRTLAWRQTSEAEFNNMGPEPKAILMAYTDGVNAYLEDHSGETASLEYAVLRLLNPAYRVTEWTPINSLTWGKAMAWDLRGNINEEIERAILLKTFTPQQVEQLYPPYPTDHPVIVNKIGDGTISRQPSAASTAGSDISLGTLEAAQANVSILDEMLGAPGHAIGSNSWAVSGKLTNTGMPILANDPHLAIQMPSIWYQVDMHCTPKSDKCPYEMAGFSFAGVPGVIIGHNAEIAWGFTNTEADVMDLFIEKVNPDNPNQYEVDGKWVDFETHNETINVVNGKPVAATVRWTRHGPVISDSYGDVTDKNPEHSREFVSFRERAGISLPEQYAISLEWTALKPSSPFEAIWGFNKAANWDEFRAAARRFHVPAQNLLYADAQGNIGYQMPGDIPIRKKGDGRFPVPGWTSEYEWTGFIPFDELPYTYNPAEGYIVTANNEIPPAGYDHYIAAEWDYGFRANRILEMIQRAPAKLSMAYVQKMQGDMYDSNAAVFVPLLLDLNARRSLGQDTAIGLLKNWNYQAESGSPAAAVFEAFWRHLLQNAFGDDMPKDDQPDGGSGWNEIMRNMANNPNDPFWDYNDTQGKVETMDDILDKSLTDGINEVKGHFGANAETWKWGMLHAANFRNQTLGESGVSLIEALFNRGPFEIGGGEAIVDATGWSVNEGYQTNWVPSMRMVVDLSNLSNSVAIHTTGQSGHAYSPHYDDMAPLWSVIAYAPMLWDAETVKLEAESHLILTP